ncbi:MAG TPA: helix-turn-helix domain-containing protein [Stellaceae bacterium]|nr:helix-turn-helix domain-containing protein [Stellaceae bacterium]
MSKRSAAVSLCPMDGILRLLMGPWTTYIVWLLRTNGPIRFGALKRYMPGISAKVLTERLRHLEAAGLVDRTYKPTIPPEVTYAPTARAVELYPMLDALSQVAMRWAEQDAVRPDTGQTKAIAGDEARTVEAA